MPSAPRQSERRLRNALSLATALAGIAAVSVCLADPGQTPVDQPVATKATASAAADQPEVVSALTLPRPAHDITVSKDGRIFMMMVGAPALVEWVGGELRAYPDAGWNDAKARDHFTKAESLIQETGYHRRDPELANLRAQLKPMLS